MRKGIRCLITKIKARQIIDSRGIPTIEVDLYTNKGMYRDAAPGGASTGLYGAVELRDGEKGKFLGMGVSRAVKNVNEKIYEALIGLDPIVQSQIDQAMIDLDKTENKVKYCLENNKRLIHFSTCEVYGKTIGSFLLADHPLCQRVRAIVHAVMHYNDAHVLAETSCGLVDSMERLNLNEDRGEQSGSEGVD
ncbi:hypothetical protein IFM89_006266 [Coptis chinensis]|uniref:Enolase N-terminal domain-containing protein n=1 Tax=Coptis chinensis TaxID=261450 RepID=A0A835GUS7_9MAGN|nr:hypothetical protein IFM89_006266 [Coptis chinensis]